MEPSGPDLARSPFRQWTIERGSPYADAAGACGGGAHCRAIQRTGRAPAQARPPSPTEHLYGLPKPAKAPHNPKPMPFAAQYRHHVWSTDVRYVDHALGDFKVYAITILDNYSRAVLASDLSLTQDLGAFLRVFR